MCLTIMKFLPEFSKTTRMAVFLDLFPGDQIAAVILEWDFSGNEAHCIWPYNFHNSVLSLLLLIISITLLPIHTDKRAGSSMS